MIPTQTKRPIKLKQPRANDLTKEALRILNLKGYRVWRQNSVGIWDAKINCYRKNINNLKGIADILGYNRRTGQFIACEIKAGRDKLSEAQKLFLEDVIASGGIALVIRSGDDLVKFLKS